ncbi:MAG: DUF5714 domain-containing protein [Pseudomonadota bacterium]
MHNAKWPAREVAFKGNASAGNWTERFTKISCGTHSIYIDPETPFWFVPNPAAEDLPAAAGGTAGGPPGLNNGCDALSCMDMDALMRMTDVPRQSPYAGRKHLPLRRLSELWFHLTDACNCTCRHCLFGDRTGPVRSLSPKVIEALVDEAYDLGVRVVCFTGGEPFAYPDFPGLIERVLRREDLRVAVLTNAMLLPGRLKDLFALDTERMHFQVSLDGPESVHDAIRGKGSFTETSASVRAMVESGLTCSAAMAVNGANVVNMAEVVGIAHDLGACAIHFMWHFDRGSGKTVSLRSETRLVENFRIAASAARTLGLTVDNLEAVKARVFSHPGTRFDFGNAGWESLAIGPDGSVYPTPAMVDLGVSRAGNVRDGLEKVWRDSEVLERIRRASLTEVPQMRSDPWRLIIGGGDLDHCAAANGGPSGGITLGDDPYRKIYRFMAELVITEELRCLPVPDGPGLILRMGDITTDCPSGEDVNFTHCNCLLSMGDGGTTALVREFYSERASATDELILNPIQLAEEETRFIPAEAKARMYGCGSPVGDAGLKAGETLVDLGSGTGVECFIAARDVGPTGKAIGVDMTDAMLDIACRAKESVNQELGYANIEFKKGYLESLPLSNETADAVISNCVVNLSHNKRRVFNEIFRVLKPGGRLVISDVVCEREPPLNVRGDHRLIGECIGGSLVQDYLFAMLRDVGFVNAEVLKRFPYREVQGHQFYSLTFRAYKPEHGEERDVIYAGPFRAVVSDNGQVLHKGLRSRVTLGPGWDGASLAGSGILTVDTASGAIDNIDAESDCACFVPSTAALKVVPDSAPETGCLICGEPLVYGPVNMELVCSVCGTRERTRVQCTRGHYVCDACHIREPIQVAKNFCLASEETDVYQLFSRIAAHPVIPLHGPEYHGIVPGVILAAYRNAGGPVTEEQILEGIGRGSAVPGGSCAFMGVCGAAVGVGIAFGIMLSANPLTPAPRQHVQRITARALERISSVKAARCCRRESHLALQTAAEESENLLPIRIRAEAWESCGRHGLNKECIKQSCPFFRRGYP